VKKDIDAVTIRRNRPCPAAEERCPRCRRSRSTGLPGHGVPVRGPPGLRPIVSPHSSPYPPGFAGFEAHFRRKASTPSTSGDPSGGRRAHGRGAVGPKRRGSRATLRRKAFPEPFEGGQPLRQRGTIPTQGTRSSGSRRQFPVRVRKALAGTSGDWSRLGQPRTARGAAGGFAKSAVGISRAPLTRRGGERRAHCG